MDILELKCEEPCASSDDVYKNLEIMRIKNPKLFMEFVNRRKEITHEMIQKGALPSDTLHQKLWDFNYGKRYTEVNEVYLFYTTTHGSAKMIMKRGFTPVATTSNVSVVQEINFTDRITQMDLLTDNPGRRESDNTKPAVLLCRVVLGNVFSCDDTGRPLHEDKAPENADNASRGDGEGTLPARGDGQAEACWTPQNHSLLVEGQEPQQRRFVVADYRQCFPEFIITYKQIGKKSPTAVTLPNPPQSKDQTHKTSVLDWLVDLARKTFVDQGQRT
ncbi:hypothetical protein BsWGS_03014 [Bradybaena similaris]